MVLPAHLMYRYPRMLFSVWDSSGKCWTSWRVMAYAGKPDRPASSATKCVHHVSLVVVVVVVVDMLVKNRAGIVVMIVVVVRHQHIHSLARSLAAVGKQALLG